MMKRILFTFSCLLFSSFFLFSQETAPLGEGVYASMKTPRGELLFELDYKNLPLTVSNFVAQAEGKMESAVYQDLSFYRTIPGYALFSGNPGEKNGGNGVYTLPREEGGHFSLGTAGALAMESRQGKDHGSRFMIMVAGDSFLDSKYSAFGELRKGGEILEKIKSGDKITLEIVRIGAEAKAFQPGRESVEALISAAREENRTIFASENPEVAQVLNTLGEGIEQSETGIFYKINRSGKGAHPRPGNTVQMHYSGRLITGQEFDNSYSRGEPFSFTLGKDGVIPGWVETALSMQPGEMRTIILPPALAYGAKGYGPIPPESWLVFEIELIGFQ